MSTPHEVLAWAQANPVAWLERTFDAIFWQRQREILESFATQPETYVPSCHASGKSYTAAHATLWALYTHPWCKVITTATAWHQVETVLWPELRQAWARAKMPLGGPEPNLTGIELGPGWFAVGLSTDKPERMQGQHARGGVFMIVDEADGIPDLIWEGIRANLSTGDCHLLAIGNPVDPQSYFARMCATEGKSVLPIDAFSTPNFTEFGLTMEDFLYGTWQAKTAAKGPFLLPSGKTSPLPAPWLITPDWVASELTNENMDVNSPFIMSRVLARYPDQSEDNLIRQSWIDKAWNNWRDGKCAGERRSWGVDVARYGDDKTVIAERVGGRYRILESASAMDGPEVAEMVLRHWHRDRLERASFDKPTVAIDVVGVGASVYDSLKKHVPTIAVESAGRCEADENAERFINKRAEMWWGFRESLRMGEIALDPQDRQLARELVSVKYKVNKGRIQIEEKSEIKKRLKKSPDRADAVIYASATTKHSTVSFLEAMQAQR